MTRLERDPSTGTAIQEVSFWLNLLSALSHIREECESTHVHLTQEVLKHARRFRATVRCAAEVTCGRERKAHPADMDTGPNMGQTDRLMGRTGRLMSRTNRLIPPSPLAALRATLASKRPPRRWKTLSS